MALDKQTVTLSLGIGVDTKTDPKQVVSTKLLSLENSVFGTGGEFKKRNGYSALSDVSSGNSLVSFQDQLVALDGENLSSYSSFQQQFNTIGKKTCVDLSKKVIARHSGNYGFPDLAYANGLYGIIHSIGVIQIIDAVTGQIILSQSTTTGAGDFAVRAQVLGNYFIFVYTNQAANTIGYVSVDSGNPSVIFSPVTLQTDYDGVFDCLTVDDKLVFTYLDTGGKTSCFYLDSTLTKSATFQVSIAPVALGIFSDDSNNVWVGNTIDNGSTQFTANYFILDPTITSLVLSQTNFDAILYANASNLPNICGIYDGTNGQFFYEVSDPLSLYSNNYIKTATYDVSGSVVSANSVLLRSAGMYSRAFSYNSIIYFVCYHYSPLQSTFFLCDNSGHLSAKFADGTAVDIPNPQMLVDIVSLSETEFTFAYAEIDAIDVLGSVTYNQEGVSQLFLNFNEPTVIEKIGNNLQLSGGLLSMFDGQNSVEHGFNLYPEGISASPATTGGSLSSGSYEYAVTYEWTDAQGQLHRSAPSVPVQVTTTTGSSKVTLQLPTLRLTDKADVLIVVYRTIVNQSQFYQVSPAPTSGGIQNDKTVDAISFVDTLADSAIVGNTQLYTNGGELENIEIPATGSIWQYSNRLLGITSEDGLQIWYSKQIIPGSPVEFTDTFLINVPEKDGDAIIGIQMDDKCIIFKYNSIYYMVGQGPSPNGQNNDFTTPQVISTDCGCIDKKSVVLMPGGVMFKSTKGIYLLERSLQVKYIGADVEAYNNAVITSAKMIESVNQIRYSLDSGIVLVYDYYYNQWDTFGSIDAIDSTIFQNLYTYLTPSGFAYQENPAVFNDNGNFVGIYFKTSWFSFNKIQGYERAYKMLILGEWKSPHSLRVDVSINFDSTIVQSVVIDQSVQTIPYQPRVFLKYQKCQSYQITITELQSGSNKGEGLSISSLGFEVGGKKGLFKIPASRSYG